MGGLVGGGNAILFLLTGMAVVGALVIGFVAARRKNSGVAKSFLGGAAILALAYGAGVIAASATSSEETVAAGDTKWFCGFYLDCHLGMSIERTEKAAEIPVASGKPVKASGVFHIVTVRLHNSAKNPNIDMLLYQPDARIVDAVGHEYSRSTAAEAVVAASGRAHPLAGETKVTHDAVDATLVFDLPPNIQAPRLMVTEGWIVDRVIELGLINDENSIFHKRTLMALDGSDTRTASSDAQ